MVSLGELEDCSERLRVYDVVQHGWEQEPYGFEANTVHTLTHLVKTLLRKNFDDPEAARTEIAPDSMQYALRLGRWAGIPTVELFGNGSAIDKMYDLASDTPLAREAFEVGTDALNTHIHDMGHNALQAEALASRLVTIFKSSRRLLLCSVVLANQHGFDLITAFGDRLAALRRQFKIPEPNDQ